MAIQNNINAAIGTVGSAIALGQHVSEQAGRGSCSTGRRS